MKIVSSVAFAAALLGAAQAHAACRLTSVDVPLTIDGLRALVPAKVDGQPVKLVLDSGAFLSSLDAKFIAERKLHPIAMTPTGSHLQQASAAMTSGAAGEERATGGVRADFELAGASFPAVGFLTVSGLDHDTAGLLGQNLLRNADDDYDFKGGMMRLVKPQDCGSTDLAYWVKSGQSYSVMPLEPQDRHNAHNAAAIWINGEKMRAFFDTGASTSFITARAAARAGVKITDPQVRSAGVAHAVDRDVKTWVAPFASIKIGDEEIKNTQLSIGDSRAEDFDVLIGADFFLAHHVYVANSQGKLYFSYTGGPVFRAAAEGPAKAATGEAKPD